MTGAAPALVVGAGIAGLTAALSLARAGRRALVIERAPDLAEIGAGLQLSPNALRVIERLGLLPALRAEAVASDAVHLRDGRTGRLLARVPVAGSDGTPYLSLRRSDLQAALLAAVRRQPAVEFRLGLPATGVEALEGRAFRVHTGAAAGPIGTSALFVADGVRSTVGAGLGLSPPADSGDVAWRLVLAGRRDWLTGITAWLGPRRHAVAYPVRGGAEVNLVLLMPAADADTPSAMAARFAGWDGRLRELIDAATVAPIRWPLLAAAREAPEAAGGLFLLGDAAHAMLPYAAQGAALAIEDGWAAAAALCASPDPASAARDFAASRRARIARVRQRVAFHRLVYHLAPPFSLARNLALRVSPPARLAAGLSWLYDWQPPPLEGDGGAPAGRRGNVSADA